jgi:hypothetical protein
MIANFACTKQKRAKAAEPDAAWNHAAATTSVLKQAQTDA